MASRLYVTLRDDFLWSVDVAGGHAARLPDLDGMYADDITAIASHAKTSRLFCAAGPTFHVLDVSGPRPALLHVEEIGKVDDGLSSVLAGFATDDQDDANLVAFTYSPPMPPFRENPGRPALAGALLQYTLPDLVYARTRSLDGLGRHLALAPGGHLACVTLHDSTRARLLQLKSGAQFTSVELGAQGGRAAVSLTGDTAYVTLPEGIAVIDTANAEVTETWAYPAVDLAASSSGLWLYAITATPTLRRIFLPAGFDSAESIPLPIPEDWSLFPGARVTVSPDDEHLAVQTTPTTLIVIDTQTGEPVSTVTFPHPVTGLAFA
ncbi:hypothetical protein ACN20G_02485 [Streptomyces sp. BI20]|uniref:hypothetical protein n=1 Tax=Streptomyces sp. BI20 TaxID=3403460 RepID=UPI003C76854C